jgi:hypothetical protein
VELVLKNVTIFPLVIIQAFTHPANIRNRYTNITGRNQAIYCLASLCLTSSGPVSNRLVHKVLTYVEYRAVSGVFHYIDPPPPTPFPPSECVLPPYALAGL